MEQVLLQQHINLLILSNKYLSSNIRRILEYIILYIAIIIFLILFILHSIYITNSTNISVNCIMMYMKHINTVREISRIKATCYFPAKQMCTLVVLTSPEGSTT